MTFINLIKLSLLLLQLYAPDGILAYRNHGESCRPENPSYNFNPNPCKDWLGLTCRGGTCQCSLTNSTYSQTPHTCVTTLGSQCNDVTQCETGYCGRRRRCDCLPGQRLSPDGRSCLKGFGHRKTDRWRPCHGDHIEMTTVFE
ncbi:hypothetical protein Fcan01_23919 [Folsomia candida]|uniref:Uncharacterized protein n=1 Tax=Folsomia candida TaxID=158441 RepID=A0A226D8N6_FOLCA|nr:hypothetical protein Fcan01_23919 [Folsomia candida]